MTFVINVLGNNLFSGFMITQSSEDINFLVRKLCLILWFYLLTFSFWVLSEATRLWSLSLCSPNRSSVSYRLTFLLWLVLLYNMRRENFLFPIAMIICTYLLRLCPAFLFCPVLTTVTLFLLIKNVLPKVLFWISNI